MTDAIQPALPASIFGVFLVVFGAGVILDGDWLGWGLGSMVAGIWCFMRASRHDGLTT